MTAIHSFFERHVPERADDAAFTSLRGLNDAVAIDVTGVEGVTEPFHLWFDDGHLRQGQPPAGRTPRTTFRLDLATFEAIAAGTLAPQMAFFTRRLGIHGDILFGLQLGTLLAGFFRRHPWRAEPVS